MISGCHLLPLLSAHVKAFCCCWMKRDLKFSGSSWLIFSTSAKSFDKHKLPPQRKVREQWITSKYIQAFRCGQTRKDKGNEKKIEGGKKKEHCNLHVIQIVSKECVILTLFTQPSRSRNVEFILHEIPWLENIIFTLIDFLRPLVI